MQDGLIDTLYSALPVSAWEPILGADLHYHFGLFENADDSLERAVREAVRCLFGDVPMDSTVLDAGCGWGGPARVLQDERRSHVHGITTSD